MAVVLSNQKHWNEEEVARLLYRLQCALPKVLALSPEQRRDCYFAVGEKWLPFSQIPAVVQAFQPPMLQAPDAEPIEHDYVVINPDTVPSHWTAAASNWWLSMASQLGRFGRYWNAVPREITASIWAMGKEDFLAEVERLKARRAKREIEDARFQADMVSDFLQRGVWLLAKLKTQIEKDLTRTDTRLNGQRIFEFTDLCEKLGLDPTLFEQAAIESSQLEEATIHALRFMSMLQQGSCAAPLLDVTLCLGGNQAGLVPAQLNDDPIRDKKSGSILHYPTRIRAWYDERSQEFTLEQDLALRDPPPGTAGSYPILGRVSLTVGQPAKVSWQFVE